jgi:hypothetical protein
MKTNLDTLSPSEQRKLLDNLLVAIAAYGAVQDYCRRVAKQDQYRAESRDLMRKYGVVFDQDDLRERGERFDGGAL